MATSLWKDRPDTVCCSTNTRPSCIKLPQRCCVHNWHHLYSWQGGLVKQLSKPDCKLLELEGDEMFFWEATGRILLTSVCLPTHSTQRSPELSTMKPRPLLKATVIWLCVIYRCSIDMRCLVEVVCSDTCTNSWYLPFILLWNGWSLCLIRRTRSRQPRSHTAVSNSNKVSKWLPRNRHCLYN